MQFIKKNPNLRVQDELNANNITRIHNLSYLVIIMEVFMIIASYIISIPSYYRISYYLLLALSIVFNFLTRSKFSYKKLLQRIIVNVTIYIFSIWGIIISIIDNNRGIAPFIYLINISLIVSFITATPLEMILYNLINAVIFFIVFYLNSALSYPLIINIVSFHVVLVIISIDRYKSITTNIEDKINLKKLNHELTILSTIDQLSGCKNRRGLIYEFEKYEGQVVFALLIDIDDFKIINDKYGHDIGDLFILNFAKILQSNFGQNNIFRIGGDEFFIISNDYSLDTCLRKYEFSTREIQEISFVTNSNIKMTASGGYFYNAITNSNDFNSIYKKLDLALYSAKRKGKNRIEFAEQ